MVTVGTRSTICEIVVIVVISVIAVIVVVAVTFLFIAVLGSKKVL